VGEADDDGWGLLDYGESDESPLGAGSYVVKLKYVDEDEIWVRSTGTVKNIPRSVQVYARMGNLSPWNNAICAGGGMAGRVINGNVSVQGSILILGEELGPDDLAIDMGGTAGIRNNYKDMPPDLAARIPECPTTSFDGETVESLNAILRVKHGKVGLSGTATVGEENDSNNSFKETMDGVYVTDGYGGNKGTENIYSDNGSGNAYDLGDTIEFPSLMDSYVDPVTGTPYSTYLEYLDNNSLHITSEQLPENKISSEVDSFSFSNADGSISWDQSNSKLVVHGIIYIDGDSLELGKKNNPIEYSGKGTIVVVEANGDITGGEIIVHGDLLAEGAYAEGGGFPNNVLGLITNNLELATGESQRKMTGAFFAENQIETGKQTEIAGTLVSNYFDIGNQVPKIYEVPELATNLPKGIIEGAPDWHINTSQWSEPTS